MPKENKSYTIVCANCNKSFEYPYKGSGFLPKYCKPYCRVTAHRKRTTGKYEQVINSCRSCGKELDSRKKRFCGVSCTQLNRFDPSQEGSPEEQSKARARLYTIKNRSSIKEWGCDLTLNDVVNYHRQPCHYCLRKEQSMQIDRYNNQVGYLKSNCVTACSRCNRFKADFINGDEMVAVAEVLGWRAKSSNELDCY